MPPEIRTALEDLRAETIEAALVREFGVGSVERPRILERLRGRRIRHVYTELHAELRLAWDIRERRARRRRRYRRVAALAVLVLLTGVLLALTLFGLG